MDYFHIFWTIPNEQIINVFIKDVSAAIFDTSLPTGIPMCSYNLKVPFDKFLYINEMLLVTIVKCLMMLYNYFCIGQYMCYFCELNICYFTVFPLLFFIPI